MLDTVETTIKVRERLNAAFDAWAAVDPANRSKAELARQCERLAGRKCTPQTVGGWFKTGRMDKMWLPILERILGASLGFSAELEAGAPKTVAQTLDQLGKVLERADERTRRSVAKLLSDYAEDPSQSAAIAQAIALLLKPFEDGQPV